MKRLALFAALSLAFTATVHAAPVITQMHTATIGHYWQEFSPNAQFMVFSIADRYKLSDGTEWKAGAGWHPSAYSTLASTAVDGSTIRYTFHTPADGILFQNVDYSFGDHSAKGMLTVDNALTIEALLGSNTAKLSGYATVKSNDATWYGEPRFNYYGAKVGDKVYFEQNFELSNAVFTNQLFNTSFDYNLTGVVDFTRRAGEVPEPGSLLILLAGAAAMATVRRRRRQA
ncbi:PEP-CTERM sorting domain-containing protein [Massilia sp. CCM 8733]|uniref:PEP-CTERM sorting domain-containing protein n=1 Tax=Massilia mucilaginosa TaxID=2609282 RepID=A0ABX0NZE2_9BURK|nr:PEP-CTERM sorting domain-containing protein [Massilia mucilaginosa]